VRFIFRSKYSLGAVLSLTALVSVVLTPQTWAFDSTPPTLVSAKVTPNSLPDSGGTVTLSLVVQSNSGLSESPVATFNLGTTGRFIGFGQLNRVAGDSKNGTYSSTLVVPSGQMPGRYTLTVFPLRDIAQNGTSFIYPSDVYIDYGVAGSSSPTPAAPVIAQPSPLASPAGSQSQMLQDSLAAANQQVLTLTQKNSDLSNKILDLTNQLADATAQLAALKTSLIAQQKAPVTSQFIQCLALAKKIISSKKGSLPKNC